MSSNFAKKDVDRQPRTSSSASSEAGLLENELQGREQRKQPERKPCLMFIRIPRKMNKESLTLLCREYGAISVRDSVKNAYHFADFSNELDLQFAYTTFARVPGYIVVISNREQKAQAKEKTASDIIHPTEEYTKECIECGKLCDKLCVRCLTYFCGAECQKKAWPKHRITCGKSSVLIAEYIGKRETVDHNDNAFQISTVLDYQSKDSIFGASMPLSGTRVAITAVHKPNVVFVRSKDNDDQMTYVDIMQKINTTCKNLIPLSEIPNLGKIVIASFNNQFNRAMVINNGDAHAIRIVYVDYGTVDVKDFCLLYEIPLHLQKIPYLIVPVLLKDVPELYITGEMRELLLTVLNGIDLTIEYAEDDYNNGKGVYQINLIDTEYEEIFNGVITTLIEADHSYTADKILNNEDLPKAPLPCGRNVSLKIINNSNLSNGYLTASTVQYTKEIEKLQRYVESYSKVHCVTSDPHKPGVEELCLAKCSYKNNWCRGACIDREEHSAKVYFFDYGVYEDVPIEDVRRYPYQFRFPIYTSDCVLANFPDVVNAEEAVKLQEYLKTGEVVTFEHVTIWEDDQFLYVLTSTKANQSLKASVY